MMGESDEGVAAADAFVFLGASPASSGNPDGVAGTGHAHDGTGGNPGAAGWRGQRTSARAGPPTAICPLSVAFGEEPS